MLHTVLCQPAGQAGKEDQRTLAFQQDLATSCQVSMAGQKEDQSAVLDVKTVNNEAQAEVDCDKHAPLTGACLALPTSAN